MSVHARMSVLAIKGHQCRIQLRPPVSEHRPPAVHMPEKHSPSTASGAGQLPTAAGEMDMHRWGSNSQAGRHVASLVCTHRAQHPCQIRGATTTRRTLTLHVLSCTCQGQRCEWQTPPQLVVMGACCRAATPQASLPPAGKQGAHHRIMPPA